MIGIYTGYLRAPPFLRLHVRFAPTFLARFGRNKKIKNAIYNMSRANAATRITEKYLRGGSHEARWFINLQINFARA
jgi:hypothetical protein